jgi:hypothetical protein
MNHTIDPNAQPSNLALLAEAVLTEEKAELVLCHYVHFGPGQSATVAMLMTALLASDANSTELAAMAERYRAEVPEPGLLEVATHILIGLGRLPGPDERIARPHVERATKQHLNKLVNQMRPLLGLSDDDLRSEGAKRRKLEVLGPLGFTDARAEDGRDLIHHPIIGNIDHHSITLRTVVDWAFRIGNAHGRDSLRNSLRELLDVPRASPDPDAYVDPDGPDA